MKCKKIIKSEKNTSKEQKDAEGIKTYISDWDLDLQIDLSETCKQEN